MNYPSAEHALRLIALGAPAAFAMSALMVDRQAAFRAAMRGATAALVLAIVLAVGFAFAGSISPEARLGIRLDRVTVIVLLLVSFLGYVVTRYSRSYLHGDPGSARYERWLLVTLACVATLIVSGNLLVMAIAWTSTSLALHKLLTFYGDRVPALMAAHKKFLASRLADLFVWVAILTVRAEVGSFDIQAVHAWANATQSVPPMMQVAGLAFVLAACLKSAQIPFHGWLIQVMEAPTPVSALLHAGIVNLGGLLMIRLFPLMALVPAAQLVLLVVALASTVLAAWVMTTRVSIKVALAWSTCAQMGFMLVECALGAWHLALVHLVAHSLYKAHAFLASGGTVGLWRLRAAVGISPDPPASRTSVVALAAVLGGVLVALSVLLTVLLPVPGEQTRWLSTGSLPFMALAVLALASTAWPRAGRSGGRASLVASGVVLVGLYLGWHVLAALILPVPHRAPWLAATLIATAGFAILFAVQSLLRLAPDGRFARWMRPWLFAGLYLDEYATRITFRLWPPSHSAKLPEPMATTRSIEA
jgi:NAD(P)H-quinone oxidoreductase subunit 5